MRHFTKHSDQRKYIKTKRILTKFFEYADESLPDIYAIGIDKENIPYYVKRDSEKNCDMATFNLYRAMLNAYSPKFTIEAWSYFRLFPEQQYGFINDINCTESKGHGSALMRSLIRFAYTKFNFRIEEDEKGGHPITLILPPLDEQ